MKVRDHRKLSGLAQFRGVTHRDIAAAVGWQSHSYVGRIMRGVITNVNDDAAARMADFLGVPVADIFLTESSTNRSHDEAAA